MIVQQLAVILVFSQEGVRARPSTPPSWFLPLVGSFKIEMLMVIIQNIYKSPYCVLGSTLNALRKSLYLIITSKL